MILPSGVVTAALFFPLKTRLGIRVGVDNTRSFYEGTCSASIHNLMVANLRVRVTAPMSQRNDGEARREGTCSVSQLNDDAARREGTCSVPLT